QIAAQVEGSVAYGLSATFYGEMTVQDGRMAELNFHNYPILRLAEMPKVETVIVPTYDFWGGVGEPTICVVAPSVMNAIYAATGKDLVLSLRAEEKHCNARGTVHGGALATIADIALGYALSYSTEPPTAAVTANLTLDFAGSAKPGDWLEAHVDIQKLGSRLAF